MLRSMKAKFASSGKAGKPQPAPAGRDDAPSVQSNNSSSRPANSSASSSRLNAPLPRSNSAAPRERIPQPSLDPQSCAQHYGEQLPAFRDVPGPEKQALFVRKLHLCAFTFDFTDQSKNVREKEMKRQALLDLADYVNSG